jgi:hypothetical protein
VFRFLVSIVHPHDRTGFTGILKGCQFIRTSDTVRVFFANNTVSMNTKSVAQPLDKIRSG